MKKYAFFLICLPLTLFLLAGCVTKKPQIEIASYYSMVFELGFDAFQPIAEEHVEAGDRVLIVNTGQWFEDLGRRFELKDEKKLKKKGDEEEVTVYDTVEYMYDHPFFTEYLENGFINSILANQGKGFERLAKTDYMVNYRQELRRNSYIFNTSLLDYDSWEDIEEEFDVNKILLYSVRKVVDKNLDYIGVQLWMKFIDMDRSGRILWDGVINATSRDYPEDLIVLLDRMTIDFAEQVLAEFESGLEEKIIDEDLGLPLDTVLVKIDDIPAFGSYPITEEDFVLEQQLTAVLTNLEGINVLEKLYKRRYKEGWQLTSAVFHINPFLGGDYREFQNYYGTRYMIGYKTLWAEQKGEIEEITADTIKLNEKILGVQLKLIDMAENGRIIYTHFMPLGSDEALNKNFLYNCYKKVNSLSFIVEAVEEAGIVSEEEKMAIINMRMEVFKNFLINSSTAYEAMYEMFAVGDEEKFLEQEKAILEHYEKIYWLFDPEKQEKVKNHLYYIMAAHIVNAWFEEGLNHLFVENGYTVNEKLESIYARYLIQKKYKEEGMDESIFLSPLLLREWGENIKNFYDIDKVIYYIALERQVPDVEFPTAEALGKGVRAAEISQYYPILSYELSRFLLTVLDVRTGDYVFNRNFDLIKGGTQ